MINGKQLSVFTFLKLCRHMCWCVRVCVSGCAANSVFLCVICLLIMMQIVSGTALADLHYIFSSSVIPNPAPGAKWINVAEEIEFSWHVVIHPVCTYFFPFLCPITLHLTPSLPSNLLHCLCVQKIWTNKFQANTGIAVTSPEWIQMIITADEKEPWSVFERKWKCHCVLFFIPLVCLISFTNHSNF